MDDVTVYDQGGLTAALTCNSSASSYGRPVLRLSGRDGLIGDFGPADRVELLGHVAGEWFRVWADQPGRTDEEREAARRFLGQ